MSNEEGMSQGEGITPTKSTKLQTETSLIRQMHGRAPRASYHMPVYLI